MSRQFLFIDAEGRPVSRSESGDILQHRMNTAQVEAYNHALSRHLAGPSVRELEGVEEATVFERDRTGVTQRRWRHK